jgi:hypothetical protein
MQYTVQGAVVKTFGIRTGQTTQTVEAVNNFEGSIRIKVVPPNVEEFTFTEAHLAEIQRHVNDIVKADVPVKIFNMKLSDARTVYDFAPLDTFMPKSDTILVGYLPGVNINLIDATPKSLLRSTGLLNAVEILPLKDENDTAHTPGSKFIPARSEIVVRFKVRMLMCNDTHALWRAG